MARKFLSFKSNFNNICTPYSELKLDEIYFPLYMSGNIFGNCNLNPVTTY